MPENPMGIIDDAIALEKQNMESVVDGEETLAIDEEIDIDNAAKRVVDSLDKAQKMRKEVIDENLGMSYEQLWKEEEMIHLAIPTSKKSKNSKKELSKESSSNYYDPKLYAAVQRFAQRVKNSPFESGKYYDIEKVEDDDYKEASSAETVLDIHLSKSKYKQWCKDIINDAAYFDLSIGKMVPSMDTTKVKYRKPITRKVINGDGTITVEKLGYETVEEKIKKETIKLTRVDILDFYIENIYVNDINETSVCELWLTTMDELKRLEEEGVYENISEVTPGVLANQYSITDNFKSEERRKVENINQDKDKVLVAEFWGYLDGEKVNIVMAGDTVIRATKLNYWHGKYPYITWTWEKRKGEIYGMSMVRRHMRNQWALNQVYNMDIDGTMLSISGASFVRADAGEYIEKQIPNGKIKRGQMIKVKTNTSQSLSDIIQPITFPNIHGQAMGLKDAINESIETGTGSSQILSGKPTGTQLDRTATGYGTAVNEANVAVKDIIYSVQDELIETSISMFYSLLQSNLSEDTIQKTIDGNYRKFTPDVIYGLVNIRVFGGTRYLENEKKVNDLLQLLQVIQSNPKLIEEQQINYSELIGMYLEYKNLPKDKVLGAPTPGQRFMSLMQVMSPEQIIQLSIQAIEQKEALKKEQADGQEHFAKQQLVNEVNLDGSYQDALLKMETPGAE